jgi:hypothetical protein
MAKSKNTKANIYSLNNNLLFTINRDQRDLVKKALKQYLETSAKFNSSPTDAEADDVWHMTELNAMMDYPIAVMMTEKQIENFASKHGIDFPM